MQKMLMFLIVGLFALTAHAEKPTEAMIDELFRVTKVERMIEPMYETVEQNMHETMKHFFDGQKLTAKQKNALKIAPKRIVDLMRREFNWEKIKPAVVKVYRDTYTIEEVIALIEFNRTEVGQSIIDKAPKAMRGTMLENQKMLSESMPRIMEEMEAIRKEIEGLEQ